MLVSANFQRLVLGCIEADFCNQILIFQHFRNLQDVHIFAPLQIRKLNRGISSSSTFFRIQILRFKKSLKTVQVEFNVDFRIGADVINVMSVSSMS